MKIAVIGGTGFIGAQLVKRLQEEGHDVLAASPASGVDALTGRGLAAALEDRAVVIDVTNPPTYDETAAPIFFDMSTRNLLAAGAAAGVAHHLVLSVVGTDRLQASGYFRGKRAQERQIEASGRPFTIMRCTQFFEFMGRLAEIHRDGHGVRVPRTRLQPIAAADAVMVLSQLATGPASNGIVDVAGPEQFELAELVRRVLNARGENGEIHADPAVRYFGAPVADDSLLPEGNARIGATTLEAWLHGRPRQ